jgi:hypothetical protein
VMDREKFQWTKTMKTPPLNRATQTYRISETKVPRGKQKERAGERERRFIHYLTSMCTVFASTLTAPRFRTSFFHPESAFCHPCTPVLIPSVACLFLSSWVLCLRAESSVCLLVGREEEKNAWLWRCAFRLSALFAHAALSNLLCLLSDPYCRLH